MDQRMFNAACSGDIFMLHQLFQENPCTLSDYTLTNPNKNPLTIAIKANHPSFVREILQLKPELVFEINQDGLRPLDVASAYGNLEIVEEILARAGPKIYRRPGRDGRTAIHYAAMNGNVEIVDKLLSTCSDCVRDVTAFGETVLHLAVKCYKFEVLGSFLKWFEKFDMVEVVNCGDKEGNTVLHYAASRKQLESIELVLDWNKKSGNKLQINAVNKKGLTPLDIVDIYIESSTDIHLRETLRLSGAHPSTELLVISETPNPETKHPTNDPIPRDKKPKKSWTDTIKHFEFQWQRDSPGEARGTLLLVAALIATVTFKAGINPPSYLFENSHRNNFTVSSDNPNFTTTTSNVTRALNEIQRRSAETSTLVSITVYLVANSVALSTAMSIIDYLTTALPFQRELRVSMLVMIFSYSWSLGSTRPTGLVKDVLLGVAISTPLFLRCLPYLIKKIFKTNRRNV